MIRILELSGLRPEEILRRDTRTQDEADAAAAAILADVAENGDEALRRYGARFDGAVPETLEATAAERAAGAAAAGAEFLETLELAAANIRAFHEKQVRDGFVLTPGDGIVMGQRYTPIERVGVYVPGGTASYPSTVLMDVIPARIAGVAEIVMVSPPRRDGTLAPELYAAARAAGVDRIFKTGGAQAIGALAYGTESVPRVDKIVGPGNRFVAAAKRRVFGLVGIDMIAGPSEILVLADGGSDPRCVAADLLSQAEHDVSATAVLVTDSLSLARAVQEELETQLAALPREAIARRSLETNGRILLTDDLEKAAEAANLMAPEHLELCVDDPFALLGRIRNAGSIFLGRHAPEALGDYFAGPNHTLPTGGTARFSSPLSVDDFVKKSSFLYYSKDALAAAAPRIAAFADREGLHGHARSVLARGEQN